VNPPRERKTKPSAAINRPRVNARAQSIQFDRQSAFRRRTVVGPSDIARREVSYNWSMRPLAAASLLFLLGFTACGGQQTAYHYHFTLAGAAACDTGEQTFSSLEAMCAGLESASRNNSCDLSGREDFFVSENCSGTFQESP
jgi:hypothetical protein